jgi:hypothetical protein
VEGRETALRQGQSAARRADGFQKPSAAAEARRAGIAVAILGTIALILLAAACPDKQEEQGGPSFSSPEACAGQYLLAGGFFLINLGHLGALLLMESVGYRGPFERFRRVSLIGRRSRSLRAS